MKSIRFVMITGLMAITSACSFNAKVITPEAASATGSPLMVEPSTTAIVDSPISSATPLPTSTLAPTLVFTPEPVNVDTIPIHFAQNGTYLDLADSISAGTSKTYTVSASKGQIMSISVNLGRDEDWAVIPLQITGADGVILCDPIIFNIECYFWRGVLPASQDYFITLKPETNVSNFTLRVAIAPPGTQTQAFSYTSQNGRASLTYTDEFAPVHFPEMHLYKFAPELALQFIDTNSLVGTNLVEAYYFFGASNDSVYVNGCLQPPANVENETEKGSVTINGVTFIESQRGGAAAGNLYEQTYFRTVSRGTCYEITFLIHYVALGTYAPNLSVREYDKEALLQKFQAILSTVVIK